MSLVLAAGLAVSTLGSASPGPVPRFVIEPRGSALLGDPVRVRLVGLPKGARVEVEAETVYAAGLWRSSAAFTVGADGAIDPQEQAPDEGTWEGVDPLGIFWSMAKVGDVEAPPPAEAESVAMTFRARIGEKVVAKTVYDWKLQAPGVTAQKVEAQDLVATLYLPAAEGPSPGVVVVGGSSGGIDWQVAKARLLASHGYAAVALAYFGMEGLPESLEEVPLETVERAVAWLDEHPAVDGSRLALFGVSKGGELALLAASRMREFRAVVAYVPSSVVFQSIAPEWPETSSWSWREEPLAFVPYRVTDAFNQSRKLTDLYLASLEDEEAFARAVLPVEQIRGPVLLLSGKDDSLWPSTLMSDQVIDRLERHQHPYRYEHLAYDDAGHLISRLPYQPAATTTRLGGTARGNAHATYQAWRRALDFLAEALTAR